jgi:hypothetical protein
MESYPLFNEGNYENRVGVIEIDEPTRRSFEIACFSRIPFHIVPIYNVTDKVIVGYSICQIESMKTTNLPRYLRNNYE